MKIVLAGATGKPGRGALWYLLQQSDVSEVVIGARALERTEAIANQFLDRRLVPRAMDLLNVDGCVTAFRGADVVLNCAYEGYPTDENYVNLELLATQAAVQAHVNYVGVGGAPSVPEQLGLSDAFRAKGCLAVLQMGELTGSLQIMAAYAVNRLDRTDSIDIRYGERDLVPPEKHTRPLNWGPKPGEKGKTNTSYIGLGSTRYRYGYDSVTYENGALRWDPPRANLETFTFRDPIGSVPVAQSTGGAVVSLSQSYPHILSITRKTGSDPDFERKLTFLRDLGFFSTKPIDVQGQRISPWDVLMALLEQLPPETTPPDICSEAQIIVRGAEMDHAVEYVISWTRTRPDRIREDKVSTTGLSAAIVAVMLGRGQLKGAGIQMPELAVPPGPYLAEFVRAGKEITITRKVIL